MSSLHYYTSKIKESRQYAKIYWMRKILMVPFQMPSFRWEFPVGKSSAITLDTRPPAGMENLGDITTSWDSPIFPLNDSSSPQCFAATEPEIIPVKECKWS